VSLPSLEGGRARREAGNLPASPVTPVHILVYGRARFKVEGLRDSQALKAHLERELARNPAIKQVSASATTGTILVQYNSGNDAASIAGLVLDVMSGFGLRADGPAGAAAPAGAPPPPALVADDESVAWYRLTAAQALKKLCTRAGQGLTTEEAARRLAEEGGNLLPEEEPRSAWSIFAGQLTSLPVALLAGAAGLSVVTGGLLDAAVILGVVLANAGIGFVTERASERTITGLKRLVHPTVRVVRGGQAVSVAAGEVVSGDILDLTPGSYVAADCRIIEALNLSLDESALTGESLPAIKTAKRLGRNVPAIADRINMAYMGTLVTGGRGRAVVTATGPATQLGRLKAMLKEAEPPEAPIKRQLDRTGNQLVKLCGLLCSGAFGLGLLRGIPFLEMLRQGVSLAAAAVPEGLPAAATTTFSLGVRNMRAHHVLVRGLSAVETLGALQVVCFDKTGTITENRMAVRAVVAGNGRLEVEDGRTLAGGPARLAFAEEADLPLLLKVCVLCSEVEVGPGEPEGPPVLTGTPTEVALVRLAAGLGLDVPALRAGHPLLAVRQRSENRLFMSTRHRCPEGGGLLAVKGNPAEVLALCDRALRGATVLPLDEERRAAIQLENERLAGEALRVLGLAYARNGDDKPCAENGLTWLGLVGMADPVRSGVGELVDVFHRAGIETVMITGDQSPTAYAVAREVGLNPRGPLKVLDASDIADIEPEVLTALAPQAHVWSRVSPAHKLKIVKALQAAGKVVAMTGDGINDAPALKAADIGVAMGGSGTDVAREVADVILERDNLETMVMAVRDGRTIHENIKKSVHFFLATNFSEIMVSLAALMTGGAAPLSTMQLLWINLISDIFPGLTLSLEAAEPDVMDRPPRDPAAPLFSGADYKRITLESGVISAGALALYFYGLARGGPAKAATLAFQSLTLSQLLHAFSCRSERHSLFSPGRLPRNRWLDFAVGGSIALQILTWFVPGLRGFLGLTAFGVLDGLLVAGASLGSLAVNEATKTRRREAP